MCILIYFDCISVIIRVAHDTSVTQEYLDTNHISLQVNIHPRPQQPRYIDHVLLSFPEDWQAAVTQLLDSQELQVVRDEARLSPMESHSTGSIRVPDRVQVLSKPDVQGALCAAPVLLVAARLLACEEILTVSVPTSGDLSDREDQATVV